jgi:hypothetical protein
VKTGIERRLGKSLRSLDSSVCGTPLICARVEHRSDDPPDVATDTKVRRPILRVQDAHGGFDNVDPRPDRSKKHLGLEVVTLAPRGERERFGERIAPEATLRVAEPTACEA